MKISRSIARRLADHGWSEQDIASGVKPAFVGDSWSISPSRYIEDKSEWAAKEIALDELIPAGTPVVADGQTLEIGYDRSRITFAVGGEVVHRLMGTASDVQQAMALVEIAEAE